MRIAIFGMGYVGLTLATCFASKGHEIRGIDIDTEKAERINKGECPIENNELIYLFNKNKQRISVGGSDDALDNSDICFICVNTPKGIGGKVITKNVEEVIKEIAQNIKDRKRYLLIVLKSTVPPGTSKRMIKQIERISGKKYGTKFGFCMNPEFLREAYPVSDFFAPSFVVIGTNDSTSYIKLSELFKIILKSTPFSKEELPTFKLMSLEEAELFKYINNEFHAMKVTFANEVMRVSNKFGANAKRIMDVFCMDKRLNISKYYLLPGLPFGGSCLPKDVWGMKYFARDIDTPLFDSILKSNEAHKKFVER